MLVTTVLPFIEKTEFKYIFEVKNKKCCTECVHSFYSVRGVLKYQKNNTSPTFTNFQQKRKGESITCRHLLRICDCLMESKLRGTAMQVRNHRDVFLILSNLYDDSFCKNDQRLSNVDYFFTNLVTREYVEAIKF